ncbi:MAG TPA: hypothetical protein DF383_12955, partial [Deltaproteobacteria bacterium]|nr:hypothetical protein [Deltaproteobacteria bacterium]
MVGVGAAVLTCKFGVEAMPLFLGIAISRLEAMPRLTFRQRLNIFLASFSAKDKRARVWEGIAENWEKNGFQNAALQARRIADQFYQ